MLSEPLGTLTEPPAWADPASAGLAWADPREADPAGPIRAGRFGQTDPEGPLHIEDHFKNPNRHPVIILLMIIIMIVLTIISAEASGLKGV